MDREFPKGNLPLFRIALPNNCLHRCQRKEQKKEATLSSFPVKIRAKQVALSKERVSYYVAYALEMGALAGL